MSKRSKRRVAADASPLIGLAAAGQFELLRTMFGRLDVTDAVRDEVCAGKNLPGAAQLEAAVEDGWITVVPVEAAATFADLGFGEASTLTYASETGALVLMDDHAARSRATEQGLEVTGIGGVLLMAKRQGFVAEIRPLVERLRAGGFRLSEAVVRELLVEAGEVQDGQR